MKAKIKGEAILIELKFNAIEKALKGSFNSGSIGENIGVGDDVKDFAEHVCERLNMDDESGTTPINLLFDEAFSGAFEDGAGEDLDD